MTTFLPRWIPVFAKLSSIFAGAFIAIAVIGVGLASPMLVWLFTDHWQWTPFGKWLHYVLLCIPGGLMTGGIFTLGDWIQHSGASRIEKLLVSVVVVACVGGVTWLGSQAVRWFIQNVVT